MRAAQKRQRAVQHVGRRLGVAAVETAHAEAAQLVLDDGDVERVGSSAFAALVLDGDVATPFPNASPAVSDPFVVHAQRPRQAKADVALTTDDVGTLPHVGANSVTRLAQLEHAAANVGIDLHLSPAVVRVRTVADLQALVAAVATDQALDRDVRTTLMLTVAQWDDVKEAAMRAVVPDSR